MPRSDFEGGAVVGEGIAEPAGGLIYQAAVHPRVWVTGHDLGGAVESVGSGPQPALTQFEHTQVVERGSVERIGIERLHKQHAGLTCGVRARASAGASLAPGQFLNGAGGQLLGIVDG